MGIIVPFWMLLKKLKSHDSRFCQHTNVLTVLYGFIKGRKVLLRKSKKLFI